MRKVEFWSMYWVCNQCLIGSRHHSEKAARKAAQDDSMLMGRKYSVAKVVLMDVKKGK